MRIDKMTPEAKRKYLEWCKMPGSQCALIPKIEALIRRVEKYDLLAAHELGGIIARLLADPKVLDLRAIEHIAAYCEVVPALLFDVWTLYVKYSRERVQQLAVMQLPDKSRLGVGHLVILAAIPDPQRRQHWLQRTVTEGLAPRTLIKQLKESGDVDHAFRASAEAGNGPIDSLSRFGVCDLIERFQKAVKDCLAARANLKFCDARHAECLEELKRGLALVCKGSKASQPRQTDRKPGSPKDKS